MLYRKPKGAHMNAKHSKATGRSRLTAASLAVLIGAGAAAAGSPAQSPAAPKSVSPQTTSTSDFTCNMHGLSPAERARHRQATAKLIASRKAIVETPKGYEFQYSPSSVTLAELADWTMHEAKCCPFFDFHIDLEERGKLICLRLTGPDGIKPFIRSEFNVPAE
jgi:hypothetical protein